ncbi:MAG: hypothetical protein ABI847_12840 [Anaerolineales bacterium]
MLCPSDAALSRRATRRIKEHDHSLNGIPGRLIAADIDMRNTGAFDGRYEARLYLTGNRLYTVAAEVYTETTNTRLNLVDPFLDSFTIEPNR